MDENLEIERHLKKIISDTVSFNEDITVKEFIIKYFEDKEREILEIKEKSIAELLSKNETLKNKII